MKKAALFIGLWVSALWAFSQPGTTQGTITDKQKKDLLTLLYSIKTSISNIDNSIDDDVDTIENAKPVRDGIVNINKQIGILRNYRTNNDIDALLHNYVVFSNRFTAIAKDIVDFGQYYQAQVSAFQESVDRYRERTDVLLQYIQAITPDQENLTKLLNELKIKADKIRDTLKNLATVTQAKALTDSVKRLSDSISKWESKLDSVQGRLKRIDKNTAEMHTLLAPVRVPRSVVSVVAYRNNLFGASYYYTISRTNNAANYSDNVNISQHIGLQVIFSVKPVDVSTSNLTTTSVYFQQGISQNETIQTKVPTPNWGLFLMYAVRDRFLLLQAGIGYGKGATPQNISWTCGALYFPRKFGLGLAYSPITHVGLQLAYKF